MDDNQSGGYIHTLANETEGTDGTRTNERAIIRIVTTDAAKKHEMEESERAIQNRKGRINEATQDTELHVTNIDAIIAHDQLIAEGIFPESTGETSVRQKPLQK